MNDEEIEFKQEYTLAQSQQNKGVVNLMVNGVPCECPFKGSHLMQHPASPKQPARIPGVCDSLCPHFSVKPVKFKTTDGEEQKMAAVLTCGSEKIAKPLEGGK